MSALPLPVLLQAARALAWTHHGAIVRVSTLDGETWTCAAIDPETYARDDTAPTGTGATPEDAALQFIEGLHDVDTQCAALAADLAALAAEYPRGFVWTPTAPGDDTVDAEMPHAVGDGR